MLRVQKVSPVYPSKNDCPRKDPKQNQEFYQAMQEQLILSRKKKTKKK